MLTYKQSQAIKQANSWINILHGAVRSGKSVAWNYRFIEYCKYGPAGNLAIIGKTERTLRRNVLMPIAAMIGKDFKFNSASGDAYIGNRVCYVCGANDARAEEKIRGVTLAGALCDELSLYPQNFFDMLLTRLSIKGAQLFGTTNPDSPFHWLKTTYLDNPNLDLYQLHFELDDNSDNLESDYIENLKKTFAGLFYRRNILGQWVLAEGTIYDMFDPDKHVVSNIPELQYKIISIDYGIANPTVFLKMAYDTFDKVYVTDEYYYDYHELQKQKTDSELADDLIKFIGTDKIKAIYVDPSALSLIVELKKRKLPVRPADNDVLSGIAFCCKMLQNSLAFISKACIYLIRELATYSWDSKAQLIGEDKPLKVNDHACDAFRYGLYSHFISSDVFIG